MKIVMEEAWLQTRRLKRHLFLEAERVKLNLQGRRPGFKVFCVGRGKTGTTSMEAALRGLGFLMGDEIELRYRHFLYWADRNFEPILRYCARYDAFQDLPFSAQDTFRYMDDGLPESKFILTVRGSSEEWYDSAVRYQIKRLGTGGSLPDRKALERAPDLRRGWTLRITEFYGTTPESPFDRDLAIAGYEAHNAAVKAHFRNRPDDLLVLNVAEPGSYGRMLDFLGMTSSEREFPWLNKT
ncbi:sulfotransferase [Ovoidimarina sediminis]|uniref:sulfotransferase n=1 Tax=Ovoidimarina sediminis TaxID=3079856 RepID=UPI002913934A|nr:sulfotransferase [Rhodophyticola sp. MJ-SS7]MDU8943243.1 sulfotransferase [Rhodophyticola sp. MJ-SS7]